MKLLIPVDFSKESHHAISYAKSLAMLFRAEIFLLHIYYDPFVHQDMPSARLEGTERVTEEVLHQVDSEAKRNLNELHTALQHELPVIRVKSLALRGFAENEIVRFAREYLPDMIVMGAKGGAPLAKTLGGSVTMKVIAEAVAPVLVVPAAADISSLRQVVYATNFQPEDEKAVADLRRLFPESVAPVSQLHIDDGTYAAAGNNDAEVISANDIEEALVSYAEKHPGTLLSMATHQRGIFQKIFNPGITKKLVSQSQVPLLIFGEKKN
ncbi:MAG: universal stress protein [Bacteroidia bacterium]